VESGASLSGRHKSLVVSEASLISGFRLQEIGLTVAVAVAWKSDLLQLTSQL